MSHPDKSSEHDSLTIRRDALLDKKRIIDAIEKLKERAPSGSVLKSNMRYFVRSTHIQDLKEVQRSIQLINGRTHGIHDQMKKALSSKWGKKDK